MRVHQTEVIHVKDKVRRKARKLGLDFPGVSSYSTIFKLLTTKGEQETRRQLQEWKDAGTSAPRKG